MDIEYKTDIKDVDWAEMKAAVKADDFDNGRSAAQLKKSFANSQSVCLAYADGELVGTARALSDDVCNAYVVDVWTRSDLRRRGIASTMMEKLIEPLEGQHIYLFTGAETAPFYEKLGFETQGVGFGKVKGKWLVGRAPS